MERILGLSAPSADIETESGFAVLNVEEFIN